MNAFNRLAIGRLAASVLLALLSPIAEAATAVNTVDLSSVPPDLSSTVDPNYVITFDDSGSMAQMNIPDHRTDTKVKRFYASSWNLIYYNPNVLYEPALLPDGTAMPAADYSAAWVDGVCVNRPASMRYFWGDHSRCGAFPFDPSSKLPPVDAKVDLGSAFYSLFGDKETLLTLSGQSVSNAFYTYFAPLGDSYAPAAGAPGGSGTAASTPPSCRGVADIDKDACYLPVAIQGDAQRANFANWFSYHRYRNLAARTALSRALASFGSSVRIAWQTISTVTTQLGTRTENLDPQAVVLTPGGTNGDHTRATIDRFTGDADNHCASLGTTRCDFFNWLYAAAATAGYTYNRTALIRVGEFLKYGAATAKNGFVHDASNPYYDDASDSEVSCRQNFSLLITDGVWNDPNPPVADIPLDTASAVFPDHTTYDPKLAEAQIFGREVGRSTSCSSDSGLMACQPSMSDIALYYWRTDLRPDLTNNVPPFFPDLTTGITATVPYDASTTAPAQNAEIYFNPANDPATWQHMVTYVIGLGLQGEPGIEIPTTKVNWDAPGSDPVALRQGNKMWPKVAPDTPGALDDTWHATVNGRGAYFNAASPQELSAALAAVLNNTAQRISSSTAVGLSSSVITSAARAFVSGYNSSDWSGYVRAEALDTESLGIATPPQIKWDAGCKLTGSACSHGGAAPDPLSGTGNGRHIFTKKLAATSGPAGVAGGGIPFQWSQLPNAQQEMLQIDPDSGAQDRAGELRLKYIRGVRSQEAGKPQFHPRTSVLGAIVNSQTVYASFPMDGYRDLYPAGSPEDLAATNGDSYEQYAYDNRNRKGVVYVGANDGMLHAFDAATGVEDWAYVPATVFPRLSKYTANNPFVFTSFVDNTPVISDAFFNGHWHTILIGTTRLGGRSVFAIDVTDPTTLGSDAAAASHLLWEFSDQTDASETKNLGYTFGTPTVGRIRANGGRWVVLVPGGYFCANITTGPNPPNVPESAGSHCPDAKAPDGAKTDRSSLFVLDVASGALLQEVQTSNSGGVHSYGLSSPVLGDYRGDQIADFAVAGDLLGNIWRFDLTDEDPAAWSQGVDLVFQPDTPGAQPITSRPRLFPDPVSNRLTIVVGTGRYLGLSDRTNVIPAQAYYGIRELGPHTSPNYPANYYPAKVESLTQQTLTVTPDGRTLTSNPVPTTSKGWYFGLPVRGERVVLAAAANFNTNVATLLTLIPGGSDPCSPSRGGALMVIDATNGGPPSGSAQVSPVGSPVAGIIGRVISDPPITGEVPLIAQLGGGTVSLPGILLPDGSTAKIIDSNWRRASWREIF